VQLDGLRRCFTDSVRRLFRGGSDGNEQLTAVVATLPVVALKMTSRLQDGVSHAGLDRD
jgi:hypothetical protein